MRKTGINMEHVKQQNRSLILHTINRLGPVSRKDLSFLTQLTPASITQTTTALLKEGILVETGTVIEKDAGAGRRKVLLDINAEMYRVCTINIEAEETTIAICDCKGILLNGTEGECLLRFKTNRKLAPENYLHSIAEKCRQLMASLPKGSQKTIQCVSVGITGIVDRENGISTHAFGVWNREVNVREILNKELGLPVLLYNNVDAFALAELLYGTGKAQSNLLLVKWGPGVGCTIIIEDEIFEGRNGNSAEMGHMIVEQNGKQCDCGRKGCLETVVSYSALQELMSFKPEDFGHAFMNATKEIKYELRKRMGLFARCIVNTGTMFVPDKIILCGKLFASEIIRNEMVLACVKFDPGYGVDKTVYTSLADQEGYIGPVAVYAETILTGM